MREYLNNNNGNIGSSFKVTADSVAFSGMPRSLEYIV